MLAIELDDDASNTVTHAFNFGNEVSANERVCDAMSSLSNVSHLFAGEIRRQMEVWKRYQAVWKDDKDLVIEKHTGEYERTESPTRFTEIRGRHASHG